MAGPKMGFPFVAFLQDLHTEKTNTTKAHLEKELTACVCEPQREKMLTYEMAASHIPRCIP
jgi:hypothetical protein